MTKSKNSESEHQGSKHPKPLHPAIKQRKRRMEFSNYSDFLREFNELYDAIKEYNEFVRENARMLDELEQDTQQSLSRKLGGFPQSKEGLTMDRLYAILEKTNAVANEIIDKYKHLGKPEEKFARQNKSFLHKIVEKFKLLVQGLKTKMGLNNASLPDLSAAKKREIIAGLEKIQGGDNQPKATL